MYLLCGSLKISPDKNKTQWKDSLVFESNNKLAGIAGIHSDGYRSATVRMDTENVPIPFK